MTRHSLRSIRCAAICSRYTPLVRQIPLAGTLPERLVDTLSVLVEGELERGFAILARLFWRPVT